MSERAFEHQIVYEAPEPHECINRGGWQPKMTPGSILRCECGRYFKRHQYGGPTTWWYPVRWWHFRDKHRIHESGCGAM